MSSQPYPSDSQDTSDLLKNVRFSSQSSDHLPEAPSASDLLSASYDPAKLHPMASLGEQLDYLVLDDDKTSDLPGSGTAIPSRGWSDDLCYGTGTMYLGGTSCMLLAINCHPQFFRVEPGLFKFHLISHLIVFVLTTCPDLL
jgi:import inner membrane translocase subunit TIM23